MGRVKQNLIQLALTLGLIAPAGFAIEVVSENPHATCEQVLLHQELKVFNDPSLFLPAVALLYVDPMRGWERLRETRPLLTTISGNVEFMRLGPPQDFKSLVSIEAVTRAYERLAPALASKMRGKKLVSPKIVPIKLCGGPNDPYADTLGFIVESELVSAQKDTSKGFTGLPPSVNEIPAYPSPMAN